MVSQKHPQPPLKITPLAIPITKNPQPQQIHTSSLLSSSLGQNPLQNQPALEMTRLLGYYAHLVMHFKLYCFQNYNFL